MPKNAPPREIALIDKASRILDEATSIEDIKAIRDKAESFRSYARTAQLGLELQNRAAELKLKAERKAGKLLSAMKLHGGDRRSRKRGGSLKLEDLGLDKSKSRRWQLLASVPEREFQQHVQALNQLGEELSAAGLMRLARQLQQDRAEQQRSPSSQKASKQSRDEASTATKSSGLDVITELQNHREVLSRLMEPVVFGAKCEITPGNRRHMARLLHEMEKLLSSLESLWFEEKE